MPTLKTINDTIVRFFLVAWNLLLFFKAPLPAVHLYLAPPCRTAACRLILVTRVMFLSCVWCLIFQSFNTTQGNQSFYWLSVKDARWGRRRISYWTVIGFPEMPPPVQMSSFIQAYISIRAALSGSKIREAEIKNGHGDLWRGTVHSDSATSQRKSRRGRHHQKHSSNMALSAVSDKSVQLWAGNAFGNKTIGNRVKRDHERRNWDDLLRQRERLSGGHLTRTGPPHTDRLPQHTRGFSHTTHDAQKNRIPEQPEPKILLSDITETLAVPQSHHRRSPPLPTCAQTGSTILQHQNHHHQCQRWAGREAGWDQRGRTERRGQVEDT